MKRIFDFQANAYRYIDDEPTQLTNIRQPIARRASCIVCQRYAPASQRPGVCVECQRDTAATLAHVYHCAESARERLHATADRWEAIYARSPVQERFDAYRASQDAAKRAKAEAWARKGIADLLAPLILAWLDYQQADTKKREIEQWVKRCEAVL